MISQITNSRSSSGAGYHFEAHVQATFLILMLTQGHAPCLPCWPINAIKVQARHKGYKTDDFVVCVKNPVSGEERKLLGQAKMSLQVNSSNPVFRKMLAAAWSDFNNASLFRKSKDVIVVFTDFLNGTDYRNVKWILDQARASSDLRDFKYNIDLPRFGPSKRQKKLEVFAQVLREANNGIDLSEDDFYQFLRHFYIINWDLGYEYGLSLSLVHSYVSYFFPENPLWLWARLVDFVQSKGHDSTEILAGDIPDDILNAFRTNRSVLIQPDLNIVSAEKPDWDKHPDAIFLCFVSLIGGWDDENENDIQILKTLLPENFQDWIDTARQLLDQPNAVLTCKGSKWKIRFQEELWEQVGNRLLSSDLGKIEEAFLRVLSEVNPAFELAPQKRIMAAAYGKKHKYSEGLRVGVSEGLAILATRSNVCERCDSRRIRSVVNGIVNDLLENTEEEGWGSLDLLLPNLAEAARDVFLENVERTLKERPSVFLNLFKQETRGPFGRNYIVGLLWALEALAWDSDYLIRVCRLLANLAEIRSDKSSGNDPFNSLVKILLPWFPQTRAPIEKREAAVKEILRDNFEVGWKLLVHLLPDHHQVSSASYKPKWHETIPEDWHAKVSRKEYWDQVEGYSRLLLANAGHDPFRILVLIENLERLPRAIIIEFIECLISVEMSEFSIENRLEIWKGLTKWLRKARRKKSELDEGKVSVQRRIEEVAEIFAPSDIIDQFSYLFTDPNHILWGSDGDYESEQEKLAQKKVRAVLEVFEEQGTEGVILLAEAVSRAFEVGIAFASLDLPDFDAELMSALLSSDNEKHQKLLIGFIRKRFEKVGWDWCEEFKWSEWSELERVCFLINLPFTAKTWRIVDRWLGESQEEYWKQVWPNAYEANEDVWFGVEKLLEVGRSDAAIDCLDSVRYLDLEMNPDVVIRVLNVEVQRDTSERKHDYYQIIELIKVLQSHEGLDEDVLLGVEWAYLPILTEINGGQAIYLQRKLAREPVFFCDVIRKVYRGENEDKSNDMTEREKSDALVFHRFLSDWKVVPGTIKGEGFQGDRFKRWLSVVKKECHKSGHFKIALQKIGEVLIYSPSDKDGLWIDRDIAGVLNEDDAEELRRGFEIGAFNSRGVYEVDPSGQEERELVAQYLEKAEALELAGFSRFGVSLRRIASSFERSRYEFADDGLD